MALSIVVLLGAGLVVGWGVHSDPLARRPARSLLLFLFASAMIWIGTWIGLAVRTPDAVMGVALHRRVPAHVPQQRVRARSSRCPSVLQWVAAWNPVSVVVAAIRELFGNPASAGQQAHLAARPPGPGRVHVLRAHPRRSRCPASLRRYRARTSD